MYVALYVCARALAARPESTKKECIVKGGAVEDRRRGGKEKGWGGEGDGGGSSSRGELAMLALVGGEHGLTSRHSGFNGPCV